MLILISILSGCATFDQKISLTYKPVNRPFGRNSGDIFVSLTEAASLLRNTRGEWIVGSLNNVHGVRQADLLSDRSLGEWISDALVQELKQAGYSATYAAPLAARAAQAIVINDINVFMNVDKGALTVETKQELKFNADIVINGSKIKTFAIAARNKETFPLTASKEEKERIMLQSLQDAMQRLMPELIFLFNKK